MRYPGPVDETGAFGRFRIVHDPPFAESIEIESTQSETRWACIRAIGPLDLDLTGTLAGIAGVLAAAEISLFALSTFDTDYVLVKVDALPRAVAVLREVGYPIR